jgi:hypothetical protein
VRLPAFGCALLALLALAPHAEAQKPHQHGIAKLDVALDGKRLVVAFDTPLDNLVGYERAPKNDAERKAADAAVATLKDGASIIRTDPAAQCGVRSVEIHSDVLKLGKPGTKAAAGHADLEALYELDCAAAPAHLDLGLFQAFKRLSRIEVQTATAKGQRTTTLKRPATRIELTR